MSSCSGTSNRSSALDCQLSKWNFRTEDPVSHFFRKPETDVTATYKCGFFCELPRSEVAPWGLPKTPTAELFCSSNFVSVFTMTPSHSLHTEVFQKIFNSFVIDH
jgi:hypothetical protein